MRRQESKIEWRDPEEMPPHPPEGVPPECIEYLLSFESEFGDRVTVHGTVHHWLYTEDHLSEWRWRWRIPEDDFYEPGQELEPEEILAWAEYPQFGGWE